jgi:hypothetical protein
VRQPKQTPRYVYVLAAVLAVLVGVAAAVPKAAALLIVAAAGAFVVGRVLRRPMFGFSVALCIYPVFTALRAMHGAHNLPVFASGVRLFPEILQLLIVFHLLLRGALARDNPGRRLHLEWDDLPVAVYMVAGIYAFVVGWINVHPAAPINGWFVSLTPAVWYLLLRWIRPSEAQTDALLRLMRNTFFVLAALSLVDYIVRPDFTIWMSNSERGYFVPPRMTPPEFWRWYPRMQSFLYDENVFGTLCSLNVLWCVASMMARRPGWKVIVLLLLSAICMVLSMSRGALISSSVGLAVLLLLRGRHRPRVLAALVCGAILAGAALMQMRSTAAAIILTERLQTIGVDAAKKGEVANDRWHQWRAGWQIFLDTPSGKGLGTVGYAAHLSKVSEHVVADGIYFRVLAEQGVPGLIAFVGTLAGVGWVLILYLPHTRGQTRVLGAALLAFHAGFVVHSVGANTFDYFYAAPLYWMLYGVFVTRARQEMGAEVLADV